MGSVSPSSGRSLADTGGACEVGCSALGGARFHVPLLRRAEVAP